MERSLGPAAPLRPLPRARQARLRREPPRRAAAAAPQRHLFRGGCGRAAARPPGASPPGCCARSPNGWRDGALPAAAGHRYAAAEVETAFRTLQASGHIGKLVVRPPPPGRHAAAGCPPLQQAARGTVVVVGGTQGFGLATRALAGGRRACGTWRCCRAAARRRRAPRRRSRDLAALRRRGDAPSPATRPMRRRSARRCDGDPRRPAADPRRGACRRRHGGRRRRRAGRRRGSRAVLAAKLTVAENLDRADRRGPAGAVPAVLLGHRRRRQSRPGRLCRRQCGAGGAGAPAPRRRPAGAGRRLGADRRCRHAGRRMPATAATLRRRLGAAADAARRRRWPRCRRCSPRGPPVPGLARLAWARRAAALPVLAEPCFDAVRGAAPRGRRRRRPARAGCATPRRRPRRWTCCARRWRPSSAASCACRRRGAGGRAARAARPRQPGRHGAARRRWSSGWACRCRSRR